MPLKSIFDLRFLPITGGVVLLALFGLLAWAWPEGRWVFVGLGGLCCIIVAIGLRDLAQTRHAILRNYPVTAHLRFLLEHIRPEMRQYFFEGEKDGNAPNRRWISGPLARNTTSMKSNTNGCTIQ